MAIQKNIAVLEGDGIGPEIMREGLKVLRAVSQKYGHGFNLQSVPFGAKAYFDHGHPFPEQTKGICDAADAIIKGPIGLSVEEMKRIPAEYGPEGAALLPLRKRYDTFANFRPVILPGSCADFSPLKREIIGDGIDIMMIRELTGGIYFGNKVEGKATDMKSSSDDCVYTREQVDRIAHVAFQEAGRRNKKLTNVHKANVLATSRFWNAIVDNVSKGYQDIQVTSMLVDNVAYQLCVNPRQFNGTMLFENMQGDILTDQAGGILGSLGLMPSACVGPQKSYFEPAHGSAPTIAGKNIANPYSMIGSVAFMLEKSFGLTQEANEIWTALTNVFSQGFRTKELAGNGTLEGKVLSTSQFGDMVSKTILNGANS